MDCTLWHSGVYGLRALYRYTEVHTYTGSYKHSAVHALHPKDPSEFMLFALWVHWNSRSLLHNGYIKVTNSDKIDGHTSQKIALS